MEKFFNIVLFPKSLYKRISDNKLTLFLGIIFIGIIDLGFVLVEGFRQFFGGAETSKTVYNIALAILFTLLLGVVDVLFFTIPMFDLFKRFKKREGSVVTNEQGQFIKLAKVYIIAHFLILVPQIIMFLIYRNIVLTLNISNRLLYVALFIDFIIPFWFSAAISRGVNTIYKFKTLFGKLSFLILFVWNYVLGHALSYVISNWILSVFKI